MNSKNNLVAAPLVTTNHELDRIITVSLAGLMITLFALGVKVAHLFV